LAVIAEAIGICKCKIKVDGRPAIAPRAAAEEDARDDDAGYNAAQG